ncbi:hypothetical protein [Ancylobacter terrae]|uniref:hypothetical protein n=1 Tax=Ancylobacter sp. sgz301288 TaxID=3342077 RepID=UPI00385E8DDA
MREKEPLYRRVNTRTHGVRHAGGEYRWTRRSAEAAALGDACDDAMDPDIEEIDDAARPAGAARRRRSGPGGRSVRTGMHANRHRRHDYTPLFRFLLARVGEPWADVYGEAVSRLDRSEPIFWLVARREEERRPFVLIGESSYYSGLFVDEAGRLARVDPELRVEHMRPSCSCCTHTFNGVPFVRRYEPG